MKVLNCTAKGDKKFHPAFVNIKIFGTEGTIAELYSSAKKNADGSICEDGKVPDHLCINGIKMPACDMGIYYQTLWIQYLTVNRGLVAELCTYDDFNDGHREGAYNSQAGIFRRIKNEGGTKNLYAESAAFVKRVNTSVPPEDKIVANQTPEFHEIKQSACEFAKKAKQDGISKEQLDVMIPNTIPMRQYVLELAEIYLDNMTGAITVDYLKNLQRQIHKRYESTNI